MASIGKVTNTQTLFSITKTRRAGADNIPISVAQSIDTSPERRESSDGSDSTDETFEDILTEVPTETVLPDMRTVIDRCDVAKDVAETLKAEGPDQEDRSLQANEAYQTLRQPDQEKTAVGTV